MDDLVAELQELRADRGRIYDVAGDAVDCALERAADRICQLIEQLKEAEAERDAWRDAVHWKATTPRSTLSKD